jgi:hypothetical protein
MIVTLRIPEHAAHLLGQMLRDERTRLAQEAGQVVRLAHLAAHDSLERLEEALPDQFHKEVARPQQRLGLVVMALAFHQEQEDGSSLDALENLDAAISALQTWQETMGKDYATALRSLRRVRDQLAEARRALHPEVE